MRKLLLVLMMVVLLVIPAIAQDEPDCSVEGIQEQVSAALETYEAAAADDTDAALANVKSLSQAIEDVLTACSAIDSAASALRGGRSSDSSADADSPGTGSLSDPFRFNQPHVIAGVQLTVTGLIRPGDRIISNENMFNERPETGQEYAIAFVTFECTEQRRESCSVDSFNFRLVGTEGTLYEIPFVVYDDILDAELLPGGSAQGGLPFIISAEDTKLKLVYYPDNFFSDSGFEYFEAEPSLDNGLEISATGSVNVRSGPGTNFGVAGTLASGEIQIAFGRNIDGTWLQIVTGWVFAELVSVDGDIDALPVTSE